MGKLRQTALILGEGPTEFFYFKSLCDVFKRLTIKPDYPKHTNIKELEAKNVHAELDKVSRYFMKGIEDITERYDVPAVLFHHSSILHIDVSGLQHVQYFVDEQDPEFWNHMLAAYKNYIEFSMALAAEGLIIANGGKTYFPYGSIGIVDDALDVYERVFKEFE